LADLSIACNKAFDTLGSLPALFQCEVFSLQTIHPGLCKLLFPARREVRSQNSASELSLSASNWNRKESASAGPQNRG